MLSVNDIEETDIPPTEADVAQVFRNSSAISLGLRKNASNPQNRVTVFLP